MSCRVVSGSALVASLICMPVLGQRSAGRTTLTEASSGFEVVETPLVTLHRGPVTMVVVTNAPLSPDHRAGYNGIASLQHEKRKENVFVPAYAGLNFEFIQDGWENRRELLFEPRSCPMSLRRIDEHTVELYQKPTPNFHLESCTRFSLLPGGVIEMSFECIPRKDVFKHGYVGMFWASYIHEPESKSIHFLGRPRNGAPDEAERWIEGISPRHGVQSTHVGAHDKRRFRRHPDFPDRYMAFSFSKQLYTQPFYYGISHGMSLAYVFNVADRIWFSQSPTGGGARDPAWDWQFFIPDVQVGKSYGYTMRAIYSDQTDRSGILAACKKHASALAARAARQ